MKLSRFNRFIQMDGKILAFNCSSCGFAELDASTFEMLSSLDAKEKCPKKNSLPDNHLDELKRGKFVVDDALDEVDAQKFIYNLNKYDTSAFGLTIAPTMACNFRCSYCYEGELNPIVMSDEVQQAIVDFLSQRMGTLKSLGISWYGGEPLLATDIIYKLSDQLIDLCAKNECHYDASIISNGWLLSRKTAEHLRDRKIKLVQVTLDGPPEIHNARRPLKGGQKTFDRILDNIAAVADIINVVIRINVDATNLDHIPALYELLNERGLLGKVRPYIGQVAALTQACADIEPDCLGTKDFSEIELRLYKELISRELSVSLSYPRILTVFCGASMLQSYVIDPLGNLYKCWHHIGNEKEIVGNLIDADNQSLENPRLIKWLAFDPFDLSKCRECEYLPLCSGGCPEYYYQGKHKQSNRLNCITWRYNLDDTLREYYQAWQKKQESEVNQI